MIVTRLACPFDGVVAPRQEADRIRRVFFGAVTDPVEARWPHRICPPLAWGPESQMFVSKFRCLLSCPSVAALSLTTFLSGCLGDSAEELEPRLSAPVSHLECTAHRTCVPVPGPGPDRCTDHEGCDSVHLGCVNDACGLLPGSQGNRCDAVGPDPACNGKHLECTGDSTCELVDGRGRNSCSSNHDCDGIVSSCIGGQCLLTADYEATGQGCEDDDECAQKHLACAGLACELVDGYGDDECLRSKDCAPGTACIDDACVPVPGAERRCDADQDCAGSHMECASEWESCVRVRGPGDNECIRDRECREGGHKVLSCVDEQCVPVDVPLNTIGDDVCAEDAQCVGKHLECDGRSCIPVPNIEGQANENSCAYDSDCVHFVATCIGESCVQVPRERRGEDMCETDTECRNSHMECTGHSECSIVSGEGPNTCFHSRDCYWVGTACQNQACVLTASGPDLCESNADCTDAHMACGVSGQCEIAEGPGADECMDHSDCHHTGSRCVADACVTVWGYPETDCWSDDDCGNEADTAASESQGPLFE